MQRVSTGMQHHTGELHGVLGLIGKNALNNPIEAIGPAGRAMMRDIDTLNSSMQGTHALKRNNRVHVIQIDADKYPVISVLQRGLQVTQHCRHRSWLFPRGHQNGEGLLTPVSQLGGQKRGRRAVRHIGSEPTPQPVPEIDDKIVEQRNDQHREHRASKQGKNKFSDRHLGKVRGHRCGTACYQISTEDRAPTQCNIGCLAGRIKGLQIAPTRSGVLTLGCLEFNDRDQVASETANTKLTDHILLALARLHPPQADRLTPATALGSKHVKSGDRAIRRANRPQFQLQLIDTTTILQTIER